MDAEGLPTEMEENGMEIREALDRVAKLIWLFNNEDEDWTMLARDGDALEVVWRIARFAAWETEEI